MSLVSEYLDACGVVYQVIHPSITSRQEQWALHTDADLVLKASRLLWRSQLQPASTPQNCTAGYSPCLPPASDYDCAGGSGDGPKYTGRVTVTGSDPYDLDSDNDGVGCE